MAREKTREKGRRTEVPASWKPALTEFLIDTAYRKPELESVMLHIAELAGLPEVTQEINRLRGYAKRRNGRRVA